MRMIISPEESMQLPLHDARIVGLNIVSAEDGYLNVLIEADISPGELFEPFKKLGINGPKVCFIFSDCWQVATNLNGWCVGFEVISTYSIIEPSELKQELRSLGVGSATMIHYRIQGSHGSQLDFVAEILSIAERI